MDIHRFHDAQDLDEQALPVQRAEAERRPYLVGTIFSSVQFIQSHGAPVIRREAAPAVV